MSGVPRAALLACAMLLAPAAWAVPGDILFEDDFETGLGTNWQVSGPGEANRSTQTANSPSRSLYTREDQVFVTSRAGSIAAAVPGATLGVWIRRGDDSFSEDPDAGEDLLLEYLDVSSNWVTLDSFAGDGTPGQIYTPTYTLPADALHAGLRLRFQQTAGNSNNGDYWHIDDVVVTETGPAGPVAEWRLDEAGWSGAAGEVLDSGPNGLHGLAVNGATPVPAQVCNGASLGLGSYLEIADDTALDLPDELTVTAWIRPNALPLAGLMSIVSKDENFEFHLDAGGQIYWWWSINNLTTAGTPIAPGVWHHVAVTYSRSGGAQAIYIDGVQRASAAFGDTLPVNDDPLQIGADQGFAGREFDGLIDEVRVYAQALGQTAVQGVMAETRPCPVPLTPSAEWRFDEDNWSGVPGEVIDSSGNGYNGVAIAATTTPGLVCNAGDFSADSAVDRASLDAAAMNGLGDFTVSVWGLTSGSDDSTILSAASGATSLQANEAVMYFDGPNRFWPTITDAPFDTATRFDIANFASGTWRHFVWTREAGARESCLYLDGTLQGCTTHPDANDGDPLTVIAGGLIVGQDQDSLDGSFDANQDWEGLLDELLIFPRVLAPAEVVSIRDNNLAGNNWDGTPRVCPALPSFQVTVAANASTCAPTSVTIESSVTSYAGTVNLTTSSGNGNWAIATGDGVLAPAPDTDDDGAASYTFAVTDLGSVTLDLANAHADDLTITVTDPLLGISQTSTLVSFRDNAFVISNGEFTYPVAGRDHLFTAALWQRDPGPPASDCQIATGYNGAYALDGWFDAGAAHPPGAAAPALAQGAGVYTLGAGVAAATPVSLDFLNGVATFSLRTADVGQYAFNLRDDTGAFATATITGASGVTTVRPFGFAITGIGALAPNPGGTAPGDARFTAAGAQFRADFRAVLYGAGDPLDASGNPTSWSALEDNAAAPSFAAATTLGATLNTPAAGVTGTLDRPGGNQIAAGEFAAGTATLTDLRYSEVGSALLDAVSTNYLGAPGLAVRGRSRAVGTFLPAEFTVAANAPTWDAACTAFTYYDQPLDYSPGARPQVTIDAVNALGALTQNYFDFGGADDWWRLGDLSETYTDAGGALLVWSGTGASHNSSAIPGGNGTVTVTFLGTLTYAKPLPYGAPALAPFAAAPRLSFTLSDADGVQFDGGTPFTLGIAEAAGQNGVRHGRLRLESAHGPEVMDLSAPMILEYFDGTNFVVNADDSCSVLAPGDFSYSAAPAASGVTPFAAGTGSLDWSCSLAAPCPAGFVDVAADLASAGLGWLRFDRDGDAVEEDPAARVTFGIHAGNRRQIHVRELY